MIRHAGTERARRGNAISRIDDSDHATGVFHTFATRGLRDSPRSWGDYVDCCDYAAQVCVAGKSPSVGGGSNVRGSVRAIDRDNAG